MEKIIDKMPGWLIITILLLTFWNPILWVFMAFSPGALKSNDGTILYLILAAFIGFCWYKALT